MIGAHALRVVRGQQAVVDGVALSVDPGEVVALVGPNGAGKSSLLAALAALLPVADGTITLDGRGLTAWPARERTRRLAVLAQDPEAAFGLSAYDVVALGLELAEGVAPAASVREALAAVGLGAMTSRPVSTLSGGQQQRVHIARVLAQARAARDRGAPLAVLLDEPLSAQDPGKAGEVLGHVRRLARDGHAVLVVLHDLGAAAAVADRLVLMVDGRVDALGAPAAVLSPARLRHVYGPALDAGVCPDTGRHWVVPRPLEV